MSVQMRDVLVIVLGGGRGTRLFPLTHARSKPAVPIGGKYRLIDIPISNCLHADLRRIFVLTQFNSASLNRHVAQTYRLDPFSEGFVDIIAAEQTPEQATWFQGTADAVRRAKRHFEGYEAKYYLILAGDHLYRMDFCRLLQAHADSKADITIVAQAVTPADASAMGVLRFTPQGEISAFEEKPTAARLAEIGSSAPASNGVGRTADTPFVASLGIYVFTRDVLFAALADHPRHVDFGKEIIPHALSRYRVKPWLFEGYWADVGTIGSFYDANVGLTRRPASFRFHDPTRPIFTHPRFLPTARFKDCAVRNAMIADGCDLDSARVDESVIGVRTRVGAGATISRSVLLGADFYEDRPGHDAAHVALGIGRDAVLHRTIVDKNARIGDGARLVNERGIQEQDGDGWYIRDGIVVVEKGATIPAGTVI
ncbi:MAG: glucose-1-phosphate adenylyltransferase [Vicinamibacterales bacterium]